MITTTNTAVKQLTIIALTALSYFLFYLANDFMFTFTTFATGVHWIYLPSGAVLLSVLLFSESAAIGVALAAAVISHDYYFPQDFVTVLGVGFVSGFSAWAARQFCVTKLGLDVNLRGLTAKSLLKIALVFSLLSALMDQLWFACRGQTENVINGTAVMAFGNFTGTIIVLYLAKASIEFVSMFRENT